MPPPRVRPAIPVGETMPVGVARPKAWQSRDRARPGSGPPQRGPSERTGSTRQPFMRARSIMSRRRTPPCRTRCGRRLARDLERLRPREADAGDHIGRIAQRAIRAGRLSIMALKIRRVRRSRVVGKQDVTPKRRAEVVERALLDHLRPLCRSSRDRGRAEAAPIDFRADAQRAPKGHAHRFLAAEPGCGRDVWNAARRFLEESPRRLHAARAPRSAPASCPPRVRRRGRNARLMFTGARAPPRRGRRRDGRGPRPASRGAAPDRPSAWRAGR